MSSPKSEFVGFLGLGGQQMPEWQGSAQSRTLPVPLFDVTWRDQVELSSTDGFSADLIHAEDWHGGLVGTLLWGRSTSQLGALSGKITPLHPTVQGGLYLEYAYTNGCDVGVRIGRDIESTGAAYASIYTDLGLPGIWGVEHGIRAAVDFMNAAAMRRFYGVSEADAAKLGVAVYMPSGGEMRTALTYQAYIPIAGKTGLFLNAELARLQGAAARSPLVSEFGSAQQRTLTLGVVMRF